MTTLAQGTLRRNGSTGVVQQGVRQAQDLHTLDTAEATRSYEGQLPVDFLLVKKVTFGYEWILTGHAPLVKER
jgi:hypothetical protein